MSQPLEQNDSEVDLMSKPLGSDNINKSITPEDFMSLLCLSPTTDVERVRKCNLHRVSKVLLLKSRNLWEKISGNTCYFSREPDIRPSYVLLERNDLIDRMARQETPTHILLSLKNKPAKRRKTLIDLCRRKLRSHDVLKRGFSLSQFVLQSPDDLCSSEIECKRLSVIIKRDSRLDMLARQYSIQSSNLCDSSDSSLRIVSALPLGTHSIIHDCQKKSKILSINITRDVCLDNLALQTYTTACPNAIPGPSCNRAKPPSEPEHMEHSNSQDLTNHKTSDSKSPHPVNGTIKLRRICSNDWSIIQPSEDLKGLERVQPSMDADNCLKFSQTSPSSLESIGSKEVEITQKSRISLSTRLHTPKSASHDIGFSRVTRCRSMRSTTLRQPASSNLLSEDSCSNSPRVGMKSEPSVQESCLPFYDNENENPQKSHVGKLSTLPSRSLRNRRILENALPKPQLVAAHLRDLRSNYNLAQPSYLPVPLVPL